MSLSTQDALVYLMVIAATSDAAVSDRELRAIEALVGRSPVFDGFDRSRLGEVAAEAIDLLKDSSDLDRVLGMILGAIPARLHDTAYALAVEIATVDIRLVQEELRLLEMIRDKLALDGLISAAIEASARARLRHA
ncbi:MAG: tellurite resistance TerB family protein [Devosia nanyangense]|uniref:Tellurite resistance TerB family protein n=1 Tax=Devosia nanyangense TaxID=1228055 RepID=A0A933L2S1_9HYPH|nr:tellurite resistance TerB family protein [Devosia nanyangense]